jgi:hypothetical protein
MKMKKKEVNRTCLSAGEIQQALDQAEQIQKFEQKLKLIIGEFLDEFSNYVADELFMLEARCVSCQEPYGTPCAHGEEMQELPELVKVESVEKALGEALTDITSDLRIRSLIKEVQ